MANKAMQTLYAKYELYLSLKTKPKESLREESSTLNLSFKEISITSNKIYKVKQYHSGDTIPTSKHFLE